MNIKKRKSAVSSVTGVKDFGANPISGIKDSSASPTAQANEVKGTPLRVKANLNSLKKNKSADVDSAKGEAPSAKDVQMPPIKGINQEYLKRLKKRMK